MEARLHEWRRLHPFQLFFKPITIPHPMKLIPAVSIMSGRVVEAERGQYVFHKNENGKFRSATNLVQELKSEEIFVLDIDGIEANRPDLSLITSMSKYKDLWVDAGAMTCGGISDVLISGAARAVAGTKSLIGMDHLTESVDISENIIFSLDWDGRTIAADKNIGAMPVDELLSSVSSIGIKNVMLFDLGGLRDKTPPSSDVLAKLAGKFEECYVAGHIKPEIIPELESAGVKGAFIDFRSLGDFRVQ